jgi:hypothetical protein
MDDVHVVHAVHAVRATQCAWLSKGRVGAAEKEWNGAGRSEGRTVMKIELELR